MLFLSCLLSLFIVGSSLRIPSFNPELVHWQGEYIVSMCFVLTPDSFCVYIHEYMSLSFSNNNIGRTVVDDATKSVSFDWYAVFFLFF